MPFEVIPAIDIRGGKAVRLFQGDFAKETVFSDDPVSVARQWQEAGAPRIHVVDLDGAKSGQPVNTELIKAIVRGVATPVQVGGGLRTIEAMRTLLDLGVSRVILGTAAAEEPTLVQEAVQAFGEAIIVGVDAKDGIVATHGWRHAQSLTAVNLIKSMEWLGVKRFIYTDIARDGAMAGPNVKALQELLAITKAKLVASGGVSSIEQMRQLASMGIEGAIVGKAVYTGEVKLKEAVRAFSHPHDGKGHHGEGGRHTHKFRPERMALLTAAERRESLDPEKVFAHLPLKDNQAVADVGCGPGYFTVPFAKRLSKGKVYAFDVQEEMLEAARKTVAAAGVKNVEVAQSAEMELPLKVGSLDGVFLAFVFHEVEGPLPAYMAMLKAKVKAGGWVAILDWKKEPMEDGPPMHERLTEAEVRKIGEEGGLRFVREAAVNAKQYLVLFKKA